MKVNIIFLSKNNSLKFDFEFFHYLKNEINLNSLPLKRISELNESFI